MSISKFCHNCGKQVVLGAKFCPECGTNLSSLANVPSPEPKPTKQSQFQPFAVGSDEDDDSYIDKMTSLNIRQNELHVEITRDRPIGESVGSLISQALQGGRPLEGEAARPPQYTNNEQFLSDFKKEAGTSREKN